MGFPAPHQSYELTYEGKMKEEDLLADEDGSSAVSLQIEKVFPGQRAGRQVEEWKNLIVFGDNLRFLKTIYKNEDPLIKDQIKGRVRMIYIDPPFAALDDVQNVEGARAYTDKKRGPLFFEYLRRRLIVAREILAEDGTIYIHLDSKMGHYIKVLMDEIFAGFEFSEIVWVCGLMGSGDFFPKAHETIYCYRSRHGVFHPQNRLGLSRRITGALSRDEKGWFYTRGRETSGGMNCLKTYICTRPDYTKEQAVAYANESRKQPVWSVWMGKKEIAEEYNDFPVGTYAYTKQDSTGYPTQKPEQLLKRMILSSTDENDLVLDFFGGSGTTAAVAEKTGRRWITCDIGKLSFYTIQKRMTQIEKSRDLNRPVKKYGKKAKTFATVRLWDEEDGKGQNPKFAVGYERFVCRLFEIEPSPEEESVSFDGKKDGDPVVIINPGRRRLPVIDRDYLRRIGEKAGGRTKVSRIFLAAPWTKADYATDYEEEEGVRFDFLKIPPGILKEAYETGLMEEEQRYSRTGKNSLDESIGLSFNRVPKVGSQFVLREKKGILTVTEFVSEEPVKGRKSPGESIGDLRLLSSVLVDRNYNGKEMIVTDSYFPEGEEYKNKELVMEFDRETLGEQVLFVYTDRYGNHLTECFPVGSHGR